MGFSAEYYRSPAAYHKAAKGHAENGKKFGFPICCVAEFVEDHLAESVGFPNPFRKYDGLAYRRTMGIDYIPCSRCVAIWANWNEYSTKAISRVKYSAVSAGMIHTVAMKAMAIYGMASELFVFTERRKIMLGKWIELEAKVGISSPDEVELATIVAFDQKPKPDPVQPKQAV